MNSNNKVLFMLREFLTFTLLLSFVLIVNIPIISFDMIHPEQPVIYIVNQTIHSLGDLLNVYLHPRLLDLYVPFFRPSGHFLMYQIFAPLLGWHNTKGFIILNMIFLALSGYMVIKLYRLLFPNYNIGGYVAFSIYLMHPALSISRLVVMHFEFSYIFFILISLYCFILFCKQNIKVSTRLDSVMNIKFHGFHNLAFAIAFFAIATTFKDAAMMLGPVMACYLFIALYNKQPVTTFCYGIINNKQIRQIFLLLVIATITFTLYLSLSWPTLSPWGNLIRLQRILSASNEFLQIIFNFKYDLITKTPVESPQMLWRPIVTPFITSIIVWSLIIITFISNISLYRNKSTTKFNDKKSLSFLYISSLLFILLPIGLAIASPWHLSPTLVFLSLAAGFSFEYFCGLLLKKTTWINATCAIIAIFIGLTAIIVNKANTMRYVLMPNEYFALQVTRNAVLYPPAIQKQLNDDSVIIVEDSSFLGDFRLGNSAYPFFIFSNFNFDKFELLQQWNYLKIKPNYNGTLFRWAYLMPSLHEELYPFEVKHMNTVSNEIIYLWLQNYHNIFCVGYDKQAHWHDRTMTFKTNLLKEKQLRHLSVHAYSDLPAIALSGDIIRIKNMPYPDTHLCQYDCDQDDLCKGFTYINTEVKRHNITQCQFYSSISTGDKKFCASCTGFIKDKNII